MAPITFATQRTNLLESPCSPQRTTSGIAEYPDSDKIGVWAGDAHYMLRRAPPLDYWDGEPGDLGRR
jgi:hypothetical protein